MAAGYSRYDVHAIGEMNRRIASSVTSASRGTCWPWSCTPRCPAVQVRRSEARLTGFSRAAGGPGRKTVREAIERASPALQQLYADLDARLLALGDGHSVELRQYIASRRRSNFACVKVLSAADALLVFLRVDPKSVSLEAGFSRDVTGASLIASSPHGHQSTGLEACWSRYGDVAFASRFIPASSHDPDRPAQLPRSTSPRHQSRIASAAPH